jgi:cullin 3
MVLFKRKLAEPHRCDADCVDGEQLYNGVKELVVQHLDTLAEKKIVPAFPRSSGTHGAGKMGGGAEAIERALEGDMFLKALKGVWEDHTGSMHKITAVVRYMVSTFRIDSGRTDD